MYYLWTMLIVGADDSETWGRWYVDFHYCVTICFIECITASKQVSNEENIFEKAFTYTFMTENTHKNKIFIQ